ncbi:SbcC/MukB-like Walker B domain-containing protein, partial [Chloroflexota bacterium]
IQALIIETALPDIEEGKVNALRGRKKELNHKEGQLVEAEKRISQGKAEFAYMKDRAEEHRAKVSDYEGIIGERAAIAEGFQRLLKAKRENEELNNKAITWVNTNNCSSQLEQVVERARSEFLAEQRVGRSRIDELRPKVEMLPSLEAELTKERGRMAELDSGEQQLQEKRHRSHELSNQIRLVEARGTQLEEEMRTLGEKLDLLSPGDARCPVCEAELSAEGRDRIIARYEEERNGKAEDYRENRDQIGHVREEHRSLEEEVAQLERRIKSERATGEAGLATLETKIAEAKQAEVELVSAKRRVTDIEERLAKGDFALSERRELEQVVGQLQDLGYDADRHNEVRHRLAEIEAYEALQRKLEEAERSIDRERESLAEAEQAAAAKETGLLAEAERVKAQSLEIAALPGLERELEEVQRVYEAFLERQRSGRDKQVELEIRLKDIASKEQIRVEEEKELRRASSEKVIYEELATAFGKKGIQALIIETALPDIEEEANRLLSQMTDNRMHVKMETQRETKKGEPLETLDINISDELGTRRYEMYSGGEAFRINFALRIALSKLLARRAGAPLPTLIIDEGFGTQDSSGREKLIEAIDSIGNDFEKILVITHIDELKDAFPVRIEVTKTGGGSMIEVN